jgi:hypothetical protein
MGEPWLTARSGLTAPTPTPYRAPKSLDRPTSTLPPPIALQPRGAVEVQHDVKIVGHGSDEQMFGAE